MKKLFGCSSTLTFLFKRMDIRERWGKKCLLSTHRILSRGLCFYHRQQASSIQITFVHLSKPSFIQMIFCQRWRERVLINLSQDIFFLFLFHPLRSNFSCVLHHKTKGFGRLVPAEQSFSEDQLAPAIWAYAPEAYV